MGPLGLVLAFLGTAVAVWEHGVVLDAGSSGTRVLVFRWRAGAPLTSLEQVRHRERNPGLSSCAAAGKAEEAQRACSRDAITEILTVGAAGLDTETIGRANVYLRATAGLRLLEPHAREALLTGAKEAISLSPFASCRSKLACPRMIDGAEEAVFDWLSANTALALVRDTSAAASHTVGALDLGGASTQIAFAHPSGQYLGARTPLYAASRLNFGMNAAFVAVQRASASTGLARGPHPCVVRPAAGAAAAAAGNFDACLAAVRAWVASSERTGLGGLGPSPPRPPLPRNLPFVAFDNFALTVGALWGGASAASAPRGRFPGYAALAELPAPTLREIAERARALCRRPWSQLRAATPAPPAIDGLSDKKLAKACFSAAYTVTLLGDVYGFDFDERRVAYAEKLNGFAGSWALGALAAEIVGGGSAGRAMRAGGRLRDAEL